MAYIESVNAVPVECVNCGYEVTTDFDSIEEHRLLKCSNCGASFHIFDVYDMYYEEEPIVETAIDLISSYAKQPWSIEDGKEEYRKTIDAFLKKIGFDSLLERILHEVVTYGDSYLHIIRDSETKEITELRPLEAKAISVRLGDEVRHGRAYIGEREITGYIYKDDKTEQTFAPTDIVHSKSRMPLNPYAPFGESSIRIALKYIRYLRATKRVALAKGGEWWIEHLENEICLGIGIPRIFLDKGFIKYGKSNVEIASTYFIGSVQDTQRAVESSFRSQLFGQVLGVEDFREIPDLKFRKFDSIRLLREGRYDFKEEIETFKQLMDLKIITKEEFERSLSKFLGKE